MSTRSIVYNVDIGERDAELRPLRARVAGLTVRFRRHPDDLAVGRELDAARDEYRRRKIEHLIESEICATVPLSPASRAALAVKLLTADTA